MTETEKLIKAKIPGEETGIEVKHSLCDICTPGLHCGIDVYVKDDTVLKVEGTPGYPGSGGKLCTKGASNRQYLYRKNRIKTPLRRIGERGEGKFEEISWDEAYKIIAERLNGIKKEFGPESVAWYTGYTKWFRPWLHRMAHSFGSLNYGTESSVCNTATVMAWQSIAGRQFRGDLPRNSDFFIGWGCNTMVNSYSQARGLFAFKERGGKVVIIDPRDTPTTQKIADIHLKLHPGTDGALAWGLAHLMIKNGWYDAEFVAEHVHGFEAYKEYAEKFTPEETERITGVSAAKLREVAQLYGQAKQASTYLPSASITHHVNGFNSMRAMISLQVITGNVDKAGGEVPMYTDLIYADCGFKTMQHDFIESRRPADCKPPIGTGKFPLWDALVDEFHAMDLARQIEEGTPYPVKAVMAFGLNNRMFPEPDTILKALDRLDFLVATDIVMTEACRHADIVLPACTSMERSELKAYGGGFLNCTQQCIKPLYEAKSDAEILCDLSRYLDLGDTLMEKGYEETMKYIISNLSVSLEELRDSRLPLRMKEFAPHKPGELREKGFETPTGKLELWSELIASVGEGRTDLHPLPIWSEGFDAASEEEFPMTLIAGARIPNALHSRLHEVPWLRSLRRIPSVDLHPEDAARLEVKEGDRVTLASASGEIEVGVHITAAGLPGDVYMYHGYEEADVSRLIPKDHLDPYTGFPGYNQVRCKVKKVGVK